MILLNFEYIHSCVCDHLSFSAVVFPRDTSKCKQLSVELSFGETSSFVLTCDAKDTGVVLRTFCLDWSVVSCAFSLWKRIGGRGSSLISSLATAFPLLDVTPLFTQLHRIKKAASLPLGRLGKGKGPVLRQQGPVTWKGALTQRTVTCHPRWKCPQPAWHSLWVLPSLGILTGS